MAIINDGGGIARPSKVPSNEYAEASQLPQPEVPTTSEEYAERDLSQEEGAVYIKDSEKYAEASQLPQPEVPTTSEEYAERDLSQEPGAIFIQPSVTSMDKNTDSTVWGGAGSDPLAGLSGKVWESPVSGAPYDTETAFQGGAWTPADAAAAQADLASKGTDSGDALMALAARIQIAQAQEGKPVLTLDYIVSQIVPQVTMTEKQALERLERYEPYGLPDYYQNWLNSLRSKRDMGGDLSRTLVAGVALDSEISIPDNPELPELAELYFGRSSEGKYGMTDIALSNAGASREDIDYVKNSINLFPLMSEKLGYEVTWSNYRTATDEYSQRIKLDRYIDDEGNIDLVEALAAGVTPESLLSAGVLQESLDRITEIEATFPELSALVGEDVNWGNYESSIEKYNAGIVAQNELNAAESEAYNAALARMNEEAGVTGEDNSYNLAELVATADRQDLITVFGAEAVADAESLAETLGELEPYKSGDGYNLVAASTDGVKPDVLRAAGFTDTEIIESREFARGDKVPSWDEFVAIYKGVLPEGSLYDEYTKRYGVGAFVTSGYKKLGDFAVDLVPLTWVRNLDKMSPLEIAGNIAMDALVLVPVVGIVASKAAKAASSSVRVISSVDDFVAAEKLLSKQTAASLSKVYGPDVVKSFKAVQTAEAKYARAVLRTELLTDTKAVSKATQLKAKSKLTPAEVKDLKAFDASKNSRLLREELKAKQELETAANNFTSLIKTAVPKTHTVVRIPGGVQTTVKGRGGFDSPVIQSEFIDLGKTLPNAIRQTVLDIVARKGRTLTGKVTKAEIKRLENAVNVARDKYNKAVAEAAKNPTSESMRTGGKFTDLYTDVLNAEAKLALAKNGNLAQSIGRINELKAKGQLTAAERSELIRLENSTVNAFNRLEVEWSAASKGGAKGGVAVKSPPVVKGTSVKTSASVKARPVNTSAIAAGSLAQSVTTRVGEVAQPSRIGFPMPSVKPTVKPVVVEGFGLAPSSGIVSMANPQIVPDTLNASATETLSETATETAAKTATETTVKTATAVKTGTGATTGAKIRRGLIFPPPGASLPASSIFNPKGSIAWYAGELNGEKQWYVVNHPYQSADDMVRYIGELPAGVKSVEGEGAAYRSIQTITGQAPDFLSIDMGIQDITITSKKNVPRIRFVADKSRRTKSKITVKGGNVKTVKPGMAVIKRRK